jgi:hypothetical protein
MLTASPSIASAVRRVVASPRQKISARPQT